MLTRVFSCLTLLLLTASCGDRAKTEEEAIARQACGSCHAFPEAELLHRDAWLKHVLPDMGRRMGIPYVNGQPYRDVYAESGKSGSISYEDWQKIMQFYREAAPAKQPGIERRPAKEETNQFTVVPFETTGSSPATSFIRIDPGNHTIYVADAGDSSFSVYTDRGKGMASYKAGGVIIDTQFDSDLRSPGMRKGLATFIGLMNPNNGRTGSVAPFALFAAPFFRAPALFDSLPRPVQGVPADLDADGQEDYLICGFGHDAGAFFWMKNNNGRFEQRMLRPLPGAIRAIVEDFNADGLPDIMALFAQAGEGIYLFTNKGGGRFDTKALLQFPPVYGSSFFDLLDLDGDGRKDILYTCGDNADLTAGVLKNYHGIYAYLNKGGDRYEQAFFIPMYGCYKAMARDYDGDGDLDLTAISYFPDRKNRPQESFLYFVNGGGFRFTPYTIRAAPAGHWLTMDAGDADGDGDEDIVIGNMVPPNPTGRPDTSKPLSPAFLLLRNNQR